MQANDVSFLSQKEATEILILLSHKPGVQMLQVLVVTVASDTDPGSQTALLHCSPRDQIYVSTSQS